jgi:hypothetical protein
MKIESRFRSGDELCVRLWVCFGKKNKKKKTKQKKPKKKKKKKDTQPRRRCLGLARCLGAAREPREHRIVRRAPGRRDSPMHRRVAGKDEEHVLDDFLKEEKLLAHRGVGHVAPHELIRDKLPVLDIAVQEIKQGPALLARGARGRRRRRGCGVCVFFVMLFLLHVHLDESIEFGRCKRKAK